MSKKNVEIEDTPNFRKNNSNTNILNNNKLLEKFPENYKNCRFILLDTETTGLNLSIDRLISINAVEMINCELTGIQFNAYLNKRFTDNNQPIMYYLSEYNYSRNNNIKKSLETFLDFVSDSIVITHNATFNMKFINININPKDLHQGIIDVIVYGRVVAKMLEDGICNEYDNYDFEEGNSIINCTHVDINYNINSSEDEYEYSGELNEEEVDTDNEDIKKSKSEEIKNKVDANINNSFDKNLKNNINEFKYIEINCLRNYKNNDKGKYYDENYINNKKTKNKKKLFNSCIGYKNIENIKKYDNKFSHPINGFNKNKRKIKDISKEEPKMDFLKNAFKNYIKDNHKNIKVKES